jgi:hypothetical protein
MNIQPYIERLRECVPHARLVGGSADFEAAQRGTLTPPAVFVMPLTERPADPAADPWCAGAGRLCHFGVLQVVENFRNNTGEDALVDLQTLRMQVRAALHGWTPERGGDPIRFVLGELVQCDGDARLWWSDEFVDTVYRH